MRIKCENSKTAQKETETNRIIKMLSKWIVLTLSRMCVSSNEQLFVTELGKTLEKKDVLRSPWQHPEPCSRNKKSSHCYQSNKQPIDRNVRFFSLSLSLLFKKPQCNRAFLGHLRLSGKSIATAVWCDRCGESEIESEHPREEQTKKRHRQTGIRHGAVCNYCAVWEQWFASQCVAAAVAVGHFDGNPINTCCEKSGKVLCHNGKEREREARATHEFKQIMQHSINDAMLSIDTHASASNK